MRSDGNPHANPVGYFVTHSLVGSAGRLSGRGRYNWLRDIQSVTPLEEIPRWVISNYFYREMSPWLRYAVVPFLILFGVSVVNLVGLLLEASGIVGTRIFLDDRLLAPLGFAGSILGIIFTVNAVVIGLLLLVSIPLLIFYRDVRRTLVRFDVLGTIPPSAQRMPPASKRPKRCSRPTPRHTSSSTDTPTTPHSSASARGR